MLSRGTPQWTEVRLCCGVDKNEEMSHHGEGVVMPGRLGVVTVRSQVMSALLVLSKVRPSGSKRRRSKSRRKDIR